jgi:DNA-binding NtrC family response regulator
VGAVVAHSPPMIELYKTVAQIAPASITVLIIGESGSGKELVARTIHARSARSDRPFVAVNCAALPESLLESELFGHVRGAFTGAVADRKGLFEEATGGTLFLDEIGHVSPKMQGELLRVLQEGEVRRVGGGVVKVDVRVIAATNRELEPQVASGAFRSDLYYRLNVVTLRVPPLRERRSDIPPLIAHFLSIQAERAGRSVPRVAPEALAALGEYGWPGNVRELENVVARALAVSRPGGIVKDDLPGEVASGEAAPAMQVEGAEDWPTLEELSYRYVARVLDRTGGNRTRAAEILGVDRRTLSRMANRRKKDDPSDPSDGA